MLSAPDRLESVRRILLDSENTLYLSAASAWEITVKHGLGKLELPLLPSEFIPSRLAITGVTPLPLTIEDTFGLTDLPRHHRDPFDRILIAQALRRGLRFMSADTQLRSYKADFIFIG